MTKITSQTLQKGTAEKATVQATPENRRGP